MAIVTLLTDFGTRDSYVAQMKAVILKNCRSCVVVDITHEVERHNILSGSFLLETAVPFFPKGTVHVAIVDPGVGSERFPVVVDCDGGILVGPDNGLLMRAADRLGLKVAYRITKGDLISRPVSSTFHGRDIFSPVAGKIAAGHLPREFGYRITKLARLDFPAPRMIRDGLACSVMHVDVFGNVVTSIENETFAGLGLRKDQKLTVYAGRRRFEGRLVDAYYETGRRECAVLLGSQGYVELAVRAGNASKLMKLRPLSELSIRCVN